MKRICGEIYGHSPTCTAARGYADRMLKVEKPRELPVQATVKLELVINLKTATALVSRRRQVR
jgi:hypothetical protein